MYPCIYSEVKTPVLLHLVLGLPEAMNAPWSWLDYWILRDWWCKTFVKKSKVATFSFEITASLNVSDLISLHLYIYLFYQQLLSTTYLYSILLGIVSIVCFFFLLSPCLFNLYAEYIMRNAGLDETQAGINIARRNINNLRYADDTTLMAETLKKN